jgi:hypothetical protein
MNPRMPRVVIPRSSFSPPSGSGLPGSPLSAQNEPANHSNLQLYNQVIPASGTMLMDSGSFFFLLSNGSATLNVLVNYNGGTEQFNGAPVGLQLQRVKVWKSLSISGTPGATVSFIHGYSFTRQDWTNFQATIATIAGSVSVVPGLGSSNALTNHADVTIAATTLDTTIPANANRKLLIIGSHDQNAPGAGLDLRVQGGAGVASAQGIQLQAGTNYTFGAGSENIAAAFAVYNPAAVSQKYWWIEGT